MQKELFEGRRDWTEGVEDGEGKRAGLRTKENSIHGQNKAVLASVAQILKLKPQRSLTWPLHKGVYKSVKESIFLM